MITLSMIPACDCDPSGSLRNGECENTADPSRGVTAGQCICKNYVQGRRCDTCIDGYWNLKAENPGGCERKSSDYFQLTFD